jgi:hypothetical protein
LPLYVAAREAIWSRDIDYKEYTFLVFEVIYTMFKVYLALCLLLVIILVYNTPLHTVVCVGAALVLLAPCIEDNHEITGGADPTTSYANSVIINDIIRDLLVISPNDRQSISKLHTSTTGEVKSLANKIIAAVGDCDNLCRRKIDRIKANLRRLS